MSRETSPSTGHVYGLKKVCEIFEISRATYYRHQHPSAIKRRPGPKPSIPASMLLTLIRKDIENSPFKGEGHRKIHARLRRHDHVVGRQRVLCVMRENNLLSPFRSVRYKAKAHNGRIVTDIPNEMWGTDATKIFTAKEGWVWFFGLIEHWNAECLGWHVTKRGDRFAAIEALKMSVKGQFGMLDSGAARGLKIRMDHGSQFLSNSFMNQLNYYGIAASKGYVGEPETNGVVERFHRTFKEQIIHGRVYQGVADLQEAVREFVLLYNEHWLLEKLGYQSPQEARARLESESYAA